MKCADCLQVLSPDDTFEVQGHHLVHSDCRKPRDLSREVRALLFKYCYEHVVATCPACNQEFRQYELASDLIGDRTHLCPRCRVDLTERLREHLYDCAMLPGEVRYRAREARAANQRLLKESQQVIDRSDVLLRETEATLAAHRALLREARAARDALRETLQGRKPH